MSSLCQFNHLLPKGGKPLQGKKEQEIRGYGKKL